MPLYSNEAEISVIGSCLLSQLALSEAAGLLDPKDFYGDRNRRIFAQMRTMHDRGLAVDLVTLSEAFLKGSDDELKAEGVTDYLIAAAEFTVSPANCQTYCKIVKDWSLARASHDAAKAVFEAAVSGDAQAVIAAAQKLPQAIEETTPGDLIEWCDIDPTSRESGVTTGYRSLDAFTGVGFVDGQTTFIGAETKGGKTTLMTNCLAKVADAGIPVVYATFADLSPKQIRRRVTKQACGVGGPSPDAMRHETFMQEILAQESWRGVVRVYDSSRYGRDVETFCAKMKAAYRKQPFRVVFCDYAQKIGTRTVAAAEKVRQMEFVSDQLKRLAEDLGVPVVVGTQLTSKGDGEVVTKYASAFEQDAGWVLLLKHEDGSGTVRVTSHLNRFGPQKMHLDMDWDERTTKIAERPMTHVVARED